MAQQKLSSAIQPPDQSIHSAWQAGIAQAVKNPMHKQEILQKEAELLPRFAEHYETLKTLPRQMRRALQRKWKQGLAGMALLMMLGQLPANAATINVGGTCTLVRAVVAANNDTTATGCKKGSGPDTIILPKGSTQTLTAVNNINYGPTGLPTVRTPITIIGNGSKIQRVKSAPKFHIFSVAKTGTLTLQKATVTGGAAAGFNISVGGIDNKGTLNLVECTISGNQGCGVVFGGENNDYPSSGHTIISKSTVSGNTGCGIGGGYSFNSVVIINSRVSNNKSSGVGLSYAGARIVGSTISGNGGSGINVVEYGATTIINSTISGNAGSDNGRMATSPAGGGVYVGYKSNASIVNSTISGNTADVGGGLYANDSYQTIKITNSTITRNSAGQGGGILTGGYESNLTWSRTIVAGNLSLSGREIFAAKGANITAGNFNVFGYSGNAGLIGFAPETTDIVPAQPLGAILNTTLANNGGPTRTHALVFGSPAIDAVNDGTCPPPATDQRGVRRPRDGNGDGGPACDIGSFER